MKLLYLDCGMGAAGDMLTGALLELLPDRNAFLARLNALGLPHVRFTAENSVKCGVSGTHIRVDVHGAEEDEHEHGHTHSHSDLGDIESLVRTLNMPERVKENVLHVYSLIAEAESHVHNMPVTQVHFHEVGALDAVADVSAVCLLMDTLAPVQVAASPVHVGSGKVKCAHGLLPVPAPATAYLLQGIPVYGGEIDGELCTPTGAALLKFFVGSFGALPCMKTESIGYGMGKKDFSAANCVRALLGECETDADEVLALRCNLDDMTGEDVAFAAERLFEAGALDVYTVPIGMKKSRPGILLCALCTREKREALTRLIFKHTSTLGVRESRCSRNILRREIETLNTPLGALRVKRAHLGDATREKYEFEDVARLARENGLSLAEVRARLSER